MEESFEQIAIIYNRIIEIEKKTKLNDHLSRDWIEEITDPEFQLIDHLSSLLQNSLTSSTYKEKIIHILRYFLIICDGNSVKNQLKEIGSLPVILSQLLITSSKPQIVKDSFCIISNIFNIQYFNKVIDLHFITHIFNTLDSVEEDEVLSNAIAILIDINAIYTTNVNDNLFLTVYHQHHNSRLIDEVLLRILNNETNKEKMVKILRCIINIIDKKGNIVFYSSDLESFLDISLSKLESTYTEEIKLYFIKVIQKITYYDEYYKGMYKINELTDLMEDYVANEDQSQDIRTNSQMVLDNLVKHLQEKLKEVDVEDEDDDNDVDDYEEKVSVHDNDSY